MSVRSDPDFASESYQRAKAIWKGIAVRRRVPRPLVGEGHGEAFGSGRDPRLLDRVLSAASRDLGWSEELERARLLAEWDEFIGEVTSPHTEVIGIGEGVLRIQCDSTAWATELRRLRATILTRLLDEYPEAGVRDLRFVAPGAPSWRHGPRTVPGRGPRDTYG